MEDLGEVISIKFSYDMKILAIQRSDKSVVSYISFLCYCTEPKEIFLIGLFWPWDEKSRYVKKWKMWNINSCCKRATEDNSDRH